VPYEVKVGEVFEGPVDLLLHLITKQRVDIYEVSISTITEEYLGAIDGLGELDLETATSFLVVAATLLELKSARLLPNRRLDDEAAHLLEERDLLLARLVECATYREAGAWIAAALRRSENFHPRTAGLEPRFLDIAPELVVKADPYDIARVAARILAPTPRQELDVSHVQPIRVSVRDAIVELAGRLRHGGSYSFEQMCAGRSDRLEVVVRFLALLELYKAGAVELAQFDRFGDITAEWTGEVDEMQLLEEADEYAVGE
jgi:segregation and condensation protein A